MAICLSGCASVGTSTVQTVRIETPGCPNVSCELSNEQGRWTLPRTPGAVMLKTSRSPLTVACRADEGYAGRAGAASNLAPVSNRGAVAGGVVGAGVGAAAAAPAMAFIPPLGVIIVGMGVALGALGGAAVESQQRGFAYPELIQVPMDCRPPALTPRSASRPVAGAPGLAPTLGAEVYTASLQGNPIAGWNHATAVRLEAILPGSNAERAGLRAGDLLLALDDRQVSTPADLEEALAALAPGAQVALRVWREGRMLMLTLTWAAP